MTTQEAKKILELYRPGAVDAHDPEFSEALSLARQDLELKHWLDEHHAVQTAIRTRFKQIAAPAGLKEQILSEHNQTRVLKIWWRQPSVLAAAAAALVLFVGLSVFWYQRKADTARQENFTTYRTRMIKALRNYPMTLETADANQIRAHLAAMRAPNDYLLTGQLEKTPLAGCGVVPWRDKEVAMVCFLTGRPLEPGEKSDLFLFVVSREAVSESPKSSNPVIERVSKHTTASWSSGDKTYLLATPGDEEFIRKFL